MTDFVVPVNRRDLEAVAEVVHVGHTTSEGTWRSCRAPSCSRFQAILGVVREAPTDPELAGPMGMRDDYQLRLTVRHSGLQYDADLWVSEEVFEGAGVGGHGVGGHGVGVYEVQLLWEKIADKMGVPR